jgi:hypothetical protein
LTHRFLSRDDPAGPVKPFNHRVPWFDEDNRLYRVFEFLQAGFSEDGRTPGKVNLNTVWDPETFFALCDPQPSNHFTAADVQAVYANLVSLRTPKGVPGPADRPFLGTAVGRSPAPEDSSYPAGGDPLFPGGSGINDTLLRSAVRGGGAGTPRLLQVPAAEHPYLQDELLTKIWSRVTTRSNVFAVWVTAGFFEVTDETTRPVKLGAEVGRAEGRHARHRLFAVVDRTNLTLSGEAAFAFPSLGAVAAPGPAEVAVPRLGGASGGHPWHIRAGSRLVVDLGPNQETVTVTGVSARSSPPTFRATFGKAHAGGFLITNAGNPGPRGRFDPRAHPAVVPYFSVIQ